MAKRKLLMPSSYKIIVILFLLFSALILIDSNRFADPDLFCHLYAGKDIFDNLQVHKRDTHSFSVYGAPWIDYEWMSRLIFYLLYKIFGSAGLVVLRICLSIILVLVLFKNAMELSSSLFASILSVLLGIAASYRYFLFRPQLFTFLFLSILVFLLYRSEGRLRKKEIVVLPLLFLIWTNMHGGFPLGLILFLFFIFSLVVSMIWKGKGSFIKHSMDIRSFSFFLLILFISLMATGGNPYGFSLWKGILRTIFGTFTPEISEWKPILGFPFMRLFWSYFFLALYFLSFLVSRRKRLFDLFLALFMCYLSMTRVRFVPISSLLLTPSLSFYLKEMKEKIIEGIGKPLRVLSYPGVLPFFMMLILLCLPIVIKMVQRDIYFNARIYKTDFYQPMAPVKLLKDNGFQGHIMNEYDWGGYIHWELPLSKIYVDGRSDTVYPHEVIDRWASFVQAEEGWERFLIESKADALLIRSGHSVNKEMKRLNHWKIAYFDKIASLYINMESPRNAEFLKKWMNHSLMIEEISPDDRML